MKRLKVSDLKGDAVIQAPLHLEPADACQSALAGADTSLSVSDPSDKVGIVKRTSIRKRGGAIAKPEAAQTDHASQSSKDELANRMEIVTNLPSEGVRRGVGAKSEVAKNLSSEGLLHEDVAGCTPVKMNEKLHTLSEDKTKLSPDVQHTSFNDSNNNKV